MQEETNEKTIALYIKTGKLTAQQLQKAMKALLAQMKKQHDKQKIPHGKQTLKQLMKQNAGVSNIEITKDNMGAVNELHPLPGRGNHQDGTNLLLREVKL